MLITKEEWKDYCNYGIQQFVDPRDYFSCDSQETSNDKNLRLFRYLCLHQEADAEVNQLFNCSADIIRNNFLATCPHLVNMTVMSNVQIAQNSSLSTGLLHMLQLPHQQISLLNQWLILMMTKKTLQWLIQTMTKRTASRWLSSRQSKRSPPNIPRSFTLL